MSAHAKTRLTRWLLAALLAAPVLARAQERVELPITQTQLPDGDIRYAVPVSIGGGQPIQALLDTGSTGLRVLGRGAGSGYYQDTGTPSLYIYGSGERLAGTIALADIGLGDASTSAPAPIELVNDIGCMPFAPDCAAAKLAMPDYGIGGDGIAGQGFAAILGIGLMPTAAGDSSNPLPAVGAQRWIVQLPLPGAAAPGVLILNPNIAELQDYQLFPLTAVARAGANPAWQDTLPACLADASTSQKLCGPALLDTGAPGIIAYQQGVSETPLWSPGDDAALQFATSGGGSLAIPFTADQAFGSGLLQAPPNGGPAIVAGVLPFFAYTVLYDAAAGSIGLKPRGDTPDLRSAPALAAPATQIQVIRLNAPGAAAAAASALPPVFGPPP